MWIFSNDHSRISGLQEKEESITLTLHYHFQSLHKHLDISQVITAESSPLHIAEAVGLVPSINLLSKSKMELKEHLFRDSISRWLLLISFFLSSETELYSLCLYSSKNNIVIKFLEYWHFNILDLHIVYINI